MCVEHTDVVAVVVVVVVAGQPAALAVVSSTQDPELIVHPCAALHRTASSGKNPEQGSHIEEELV